MSCGPPPSRLLALAVAALVLSASGCSGEETAAPIGPLSGTLSLEIRDEVSIVIDPAVSAGPMHVRLRPSAGYELLQAGQEIGADGVTEPFDEAGGTLYTAKLTSPVIANGRCAAEPVSLSLSLFRQRNNAVVMGGLAAYCGAANWHGVPVRILRLAGELPLPE